MTALSSAGVRRWRPRASGTATPYGIRVAAKPLKGATCPPSPRCGKAMTTRARTICSRLLDAKVDATLDPDDPTDERATRDFAQAVASHEWLKRRGRRRLPPRRRLRLRAAHRHDRKSVRGGRAERCLTFAHVGTATSPTSPPPRARARSHPGGGGGRRPPHAGPAAGGGQPPGALVHGRRPGQDRLVRRLGAGRLGALAPARPQGPADRGGPALAALPVDGGEGGPHEATEADGAPDWRPTTFLEQGTGRRQERARRRPPLRRRLRGGPAVHTARSTPAASSTSTTSRRATGSSPTTAWTPTATGPRTGSPTGGRGSRSRDRSSSRSSSTRRSATASPCSTPSTRRPRRTCTRPRSSATPRTASSSAAPGATRGGADGYVAATEDYLTAAVAESYGVVV